MLIQLTIRNYALIRELEMKPSGHLNIITGETGAGKSIMLGAIGLLLGNRADTKVLYDESVKCVVEGKFDLKPYDLKPLFESNDQDYEAITVIRREIAPEGKSRAFINDSPVNLETLKTIGLRIMDIHSQHDTLLLGREHYQIEALDTLARNADCFSSYTNGYQLYIAAVKLLEKLKHSAEESAKELDYNSFLLKELNECRLDEVSQEAWEQELKELENSGEIKEKINGAIQALSGPDYTAENTLQSAIQLLRLAGNYSPEIKELGNRLQSSLIDVREISRELEQKNERLDPDFSRMEILKESLGKIYQLQQKHRVQTVVELQSIRDELAGKVSGAENLDRSIKEQETLVKKLKSGLIELGKELTKSRTVVIPEIENEMHKLLSDLSMPFASFKIQLNATEFGPKGCDQINFLFSANKGIAAQPLRQVASGGEFSRLMLCIKYLLARKAAIPTIIFDEIDSGISGEVAKKAGRMLEEMSVEHQLIAISHLPQIAARGDRHFFVYKDESSEKSMSGVRLLSAEERILEIARMIGGDNPSETAFKSASEMLEVR